jgi:hypothetical protein
MNACSVNSLSDSGAIAGPGSAFPLGKANVGTNIAKAVIIPTANLVVEFMVVYLVFRFARLAWWQSCQEIHALGLQLL